MIWYPPLLAILIADVLAVLCILAAAGTAFRVVLHWAPQSAGRDQIRLERSSEAASIKARSTLLVFSAATMALVACITCLLPEVVPGAMCGTGVIEATGGTAGRALAFRSLAVAVLFMWHVLERLNRHRPDSPMAPPMARALLLATPLLLMAAGSTFNAIMSLDIHQAVDCCAVVYDQVSSDGVSSAPADPSGPFGVGAFLSGGLALAALGLRTWSSKSANLSKPAALLAAIGLIWTPVACFLLLRVFAAYHYGVLHHYCPWCLFLPEHHLVGWAFFGALAVVCLEGPAAFISSRMASRFPQLAEPASRRIRIAGIRVALAATAFMLLAGLPPIIWRIRFGVWMH